MKEYRIMFNWYDGRGDIEFTVTNDIITAINTKYDLDECMLDGKGVAWIEVREVSTWKRIKLVK